jgi:hypothetical protein
MSELAREQSALYVEELSLKVVRLVLLSMRVKHVPEAVRSKLDSLVASCFANSARMQNLTRKTLLAAYTIGLD